MRAIDFYLSDSLSEIFGAYEIISPGRQRMLKNAVRINDFPKALSGLAYCKYSTIFWITLIKLYGALSILFRDSSWKETPSFLISLTFALFYWASVNISLYPFQLSKNTKDNTKNLISQYFTKTIRERKLKTGFTRISNSPTYLPSICNYWLSHSISCIHHWNTPTRAVEINVHTKICEV